MVADTGSLSVCLSVCYQAKLPKCKISDKAYCGRLVIQIQVIKRKTYLFTFTKKYSFLILSYRTYLLVIFKNIFYHNSFILLLLYLHFYILISGVN